MTNTLQWAARCRVHFRKIFLVLTLIAALGPITTALVFSTPRSSEQISVGNAAATMPPDPTPPVGHYFAGWYTDANFINRFDNNQPITGNITLHARFNPIVFTITWNLGGATFDAWDIPHSFTINCEDIVLQDWWFEPNWWCEKCCHLLEWHLRPPIPGHRFVGWWDNPGFNGQPITVIRTDIMRSISLYARWERITLSVEIIINNTGYAEIHFPWGTVPPVPNFINLFGFNFWGWLIWCNTANTTTALFQEFTAYYTNLMLVAWIEPILFMISYNLSGGTMPPGYIVSFTVECSNLTFPIPTIAGHYFRGWYTNPSFTGPTVYRIDDGFVFFGDNSAVSLSQFLTAHSLSLFARFEIQRFTVTFMVGDSVHHSMVVDWGTVLGNVQFINPATGQAAVIYGDISLSDVFDLSKAVTSNLTLHTASQIDIFIALTFVVAGIETTHLIPHGERMTLLPAPVRAGFEFAGWYTDSGFTSPVNPNDRLTRNTTLYARFSPMAGEEIAQMPWWDRNGGFFIGGGVVLVLVIIIIAAVAIRKNSARS